MAEWTIKKNEVWHIYAGGVQIGCFEDEEHALELLRSILYMEKENARRFKGMGLSDSVSDMEKK